jgi:excisionase family DNA binding protein
MARIFDIVQYPNEMKDEIVHRIPEEGAGDFRIGSQVVVRESQTAVFARDGNIPLLVDFVGRAFNNETPFTAEMYFVSMREFVGEKWGTPQPIIVRNPGMALGVALLQGYGTFGFQVSDPQQFVTQVVGVNGAYRTVDIQARLRSMLLSKLQDLLGETTAATSVPELIGLTEELGAGVRAKAQDDFKALGLTLKAFYIENLKPSDRSAEELRAMGMLDVATYTQLQAADAMRDAANNPQGAAGLTAGIGAGLGIGNVLTSSLQQGAAGAAGAAAAPAGQPSGGGPDVMTPSEAAAYLKVSEEDVVAAINAGQLKAKKIGNAFRISKDALDDFLKA